MMQIRKMVLEDIPEVMRIDSCSFPNPWPMKSYVYEIDENANSRNWVYISEGKIRAFAVLWKILDEIHIGTFAVDPESRGSGIGTKFLGHILTRAKQEDVQKVFLEVRQSNTGALTLYRKFGFTNDGIRKHYYHDNGEDAILMSASLRDNSAFDHNIPFSTDVEG